MVTLFPPHGEFGPGACGLYVRGEMSWKWLNTPFPSKTVKLSLNMDEGDFIQIVWIKFIQSVCKVWQITAIIDMKIW